MAASPLYALHRLLISFSIGLGALLLVYGIARFVREHDGMALGMGVASAVAAGVLVLYLRWFARKRASS